jgi:hypothetical protein
LEVWKVERGRFYQQFGNRSGSGQQENAVNDNRGLIERRRGLNLPDINEYVMMWKGLAALTIPSGKEPYRIRVPEVEHDKIVQVSRGIDFVLFNEINTTQQASILRELQEHKQQEGIEQYVLSYEEGLLLRDAAAAVDVAYDPGTPEEEEKRTFTFSDLEATASPEVILLRDWYASVGM